MSPLSLRHQWLLNLSRFYRTILLAALVSIVMLSGFIMKTRTEKELSYQQNRLSEFKALLSEYRELKTLVSSSIERSSKNRGLINSISSVIDITGLKGKMKSLKENPQKREMIIDNRAGMIEEAELEMEKINMNEFANLLYQIQRAGGLSITGLRIKRSFENPELFNLSLRISSFSGETVGGS